MYIESKTIVFVYSNAITINEIFDHLKLHITSLVSHNVHEFHLNL